MFKIRKERQIVKLLTQLFVKSTFPEKFRSLCAWKVVELYALCGVRVCRGGGGGLFVPVPRETLFFFWGYCLVLNGWSLSDLGRILGGCAVSVVFGTRSERFGWAFGWLVRLMCCPFWGGLLAFRAFCRGRFARGFRFKAFFGRFRGRCAFPR